MPYNTTLIIPYVTKYAPKFELSREIQMFYYFLSKEYC